jgi:hypothetical protein
MTAAQAPDTPAARARPDRYAGHRVLWVPRCVAEGRGPADGSPRMTGHQILVYLDRLNRADNTTGRVTAETAGCAARTGLTPDTVRATDKQMVKAGLLTVIKPRKGRRCAVYRVTQGTPTSRISVPVAAIWPSDALDCPPRWPHADAGRAVRALLAILRLADHTTGRVIGPRGTPYTAEQIAEGAAMKVSYYRLGLTAIVGAGPATGSLRKGVEPRTCGWLTVTPQTRPHRSGQQTAAGEVVRVQQASLLVIDWAALPAQEVTRAGLHLVPDLAENTTVEADNPEIVEAEQPEIVDTGSPEIVDTEQPENRGGVKPSPSALPQILSNSDAPSPQASQPPTSAAAEQPQTAKGGGKPSPEDDFDNDLASWLTMASRDEIDERLRDAIEAAGSRESLSDAWWVACVWANLRHAKDGHGLALGARDLARLQPHLLTHRAAYSVLDLAAALTDEPSRTARDHVAVLVDRLKKLPERPAVPVVLPDDVPWLMTAPAARPRDAAAPWIRAVIDKVEAEEWIENAWEGADARYRWTNAGDHITWIQDRDARLREYVRDHPDAEPDLTAWCAATAPPLTAVVDRRFTRSVDRVTADRAAGGTNPYEIDSWF